MKKNSDKRLSDHETRIVLICAFRYALGRATYVSAEMADILRRYSFILSRSDIETMIRDIDHAIKHKIAGMEMDEREWEALAKELREVLIERDIGQNGITTTTEREQSQLDKS